MSKRQTIRDQFFANLATSLISEKLFDHLSSILFCLKDREGRYISANQTFIQRIGHDSLDTVIGRTAHELFPREHAATYVEQDNFVFASGRPITNQLELVLTETGKTARWHLANKIPLYNHENQLHGLASISQDLQTPAQEDINIAGLARVTRYIEENFDQPLKTRDLTEISGISPTQLERKMQRIYKISSAQYIRQVRLKNAIHLLLNSDLSLSSIAFDCGYADQSAFTRQFKAILGITPNVYRNRYQSKPAD